jgi:transcriptional regulator NrdR family protein
VLLDQSKKYMQIIKRDKTREEFQPQKIKRVVIAAGLTESESETLMNNLNNWVDANKFETLEVTSLRNKVVEELSALNKYAADLYQWYEETKYKPRM